MEKIDCNFKNLEFQYEVFKAFQEWMESTGYKYVSIFKDEKIDKLCVLHEVRAIRAPRSRVQFRHY